LAVVVPKISRAAENAVAATDEALGDPTGGCCSPPVPAQTSAAALAERSTMTSMTFLPDGPLTDSFPSFTPGSMLASAQQS
jgi:hypothetical protein